MGVEPARRRTASRAEGALIAGRYEVVAHLGRGGMGSVFRVVDTTTGRPLALKEIALPPGVSRRRAASATLSFRREFHTLVQLKHPRIVEVYDYGLDVAADNREPGSGEPFYTMELIDGSDLSALFPAPIEAVCRLLRDVAAALAFLHSRRLVHRDISPRNVRCTADGRAKLIDFGLLATAGLAGNVAGTPPLMAPETLHGLPLDHRVDLYGLGALAYFLVTGVHAYPARKLEELEALWRRPLRPPRERRPELPDALDELVTDLLSRDPLARPATAAEVIERLGAIAHLEPAPEIEAAKGYLASAALVGRHREMGQLRRCVEKTLRGNGQAVLIEGPSGQGKSRLMRELALEAQLSGVVVASAGSDAAGRGPYGTLRSLGRDLLAAASAETVDAARPHAPVIARVIPEIAERLGPLEIAPPRGDPAEDRMLLQAELAAWITDVAEGRPIALLVDDVQRCDEGSAAVLASLSHEAAGHRLLVGLALRTDERVRAPSAVAAMRDAGARIKLRGLDGRDVEELCQALFGDAPNLARLSQWMLRVADGSPMHSTELARHLVDRGTIRYVEGMWLVPEDFAREDLPAGLAEAMDARIAALGPSARSLAEALSVHGGDLTLDLCLRLAEGRTETAVFAALDELRYQEILIGSESSDRFRHDGLREALLRSLSEKRKRHLHLVVGRALSSEETVDPERDAEVGWHLLQGGEARRGAELLERAGRRLYDAQSFSDALAPLEAALDVYEREGASPRVRVELKHTLLSIGCMCDRETAMRYAQPTVSAYREYAGVAVAEHAGRVVGKVLGLVLGLAWATLRWLFALPGRRGPTPMEAMRSFIIVTGYATAVHQVNFDIPSARKFIEQVAPIAVFKNRVPYAAYLLTSDLLAFPLGRLQTVRDNCNQILRIIDHDRLTPIRPIDRKMFEGAARYLLSIIGAMVQDGDNEPELARLATLELRFYELGALQVRALHHRMRGEEDKALEYGAQAERLLVQLGSMWLLEAQAPALAAYPYCYTRDVIGLKRTAEVLARMTREGYRFEQFLGHVRGEYYRERGDFAASRAALEHTLSLRDSEDKLIHHPVLGALAETYLAMGDFVRAKELARKALALSDDRDVLLVHARFRAMRTRALAEAATGDTSLASKLLEDALEEARSTSIPTVMGSLHEGRARVAVSASDAAAFSLHLAEMERWFRPTNNPVLIARCERLAGLRAALRADAHDGPAAADREAPTEVEGTRGRTEKAAAADSALTSEERLKLISREAVTAPEEEDPLVTSALLSGCRGSAERAARALELLVWATGGAFGYLYLLRDGALDLAAPAYGDEPAPQVDLAIRQLVADGVADDAPTVLGARESAGPSETKWRPLLLRLALLDRSVVVGALAVVEGGVPLESPDPRLLVEIARALYQAGDVSTGERSDA